MMKKANSRTSWFFWLWVFPAFEPFSSKSSSCSWFRWFRFRVIFYGAEFWALKIQRHQYSKSWLGVSQVHMLASCIHFWTLNLTLNSFPCFWRHPGGLGEALGTASTTHEQFWKVRAATRGTSRFKIWVSVRNHKKMAKDIREHTKTTRYLIEIWYIQWIFLGEWNVQPCF